MNPIITDELLIRQVLDGRQTAFAALVKRHERYVFTLAMRFVKNREDAHEVSQDSFLKAFRYLSDFRGECKFTTWLYKIVFSVAVNFLRGKNQLLLSLDDDQKPISLPNLSSPDASRELEIGEKSTAVRQAIEQLSPDDSAIITLFYLCEQSLDEICEITNLTMTNAKTKLCRARQRLSKILSENFSEILTH